MVKDIFDKIAQFWKGNLTKNESEDLLSELESNSHKVKDDMKDHFSKETDTDKISPEHAQKILGKIFETIDVRETGKTIRINSMVWKVAALFLFLGFSYTYLLHLTDHNTIIGDPHHGNTPQLYTINALHDSLVHQLTDGSKVIVFKNSKIRYDEKFGIENRNIFLEGKARFDVQRDTTLPFTVHANGYTTTALGTTFVVDGNDQKLTKVYLLSGKVVVRSTSNSPMPIEDTYLLVNQELNIDARTKLASIEKKVEHKPFVSAKEKLSKSTQQQEVSERKEVDYLVFNQTDLAAVFGQLNKDYGLQVDFDDHDMEGLFFTGRFARKTSGLTILKIVAEINGLSVVSSDNNRIKVIKNVEAITTDSLKPKNNNQIPIK